MTSDDLAALAEQGRYWWMRSDQTFYATTEYEPESPTDTYLLDASPEWVEQWGGDWDAAFAVLKPAISKLFPEETP